MHWTDRLSDYLDDDLSPAEREACEVHLAACEPCRTVLAEIRHVSEAARLDADTMPAADLWPGVLARITTGGMQKDARAADVVDLRARREARRISFTLPQLALAASLLIAVSSGLAYLAAGRARNAPAPVDAPVQAVAEPIDPLSTGVARTSFADVQFDRAVTDLEQVLAEQRERLDPRTIMVIERNLAAIDEAIRQARAALNADPANPFLNSHLADARQRKLELLRRAAEIAGD